MNQTGNQFQSGQRSGRTQDWARQTGEQNDSESQQHNQSARSQNRDQNDNFMTFAEVAIRGTARLLDIELATMRTFWQIQARGAAAFGAPDYSDLIRQAESGAQRLLSTSTEQMLDGAHQAAETIREMQTQMGQIVEHGAIELTEEIRNGMQELGERSRQGAGAVREMTASAASQAQANTSRSSSRTQQGQQGQQAEESEQDMERHASDQSENQNGSQEAGRGNSQKRNQERHARSGKRH